MIRYAIWAAVSTESQAAPDKISLTDQEARCRTVAAAKGWRETAGPYVVPGESRTRWVNLRDAENAIPQLRAMLNAAQRGQFDVLIIYDYNRLRELIDPVARTLASYRVQVYSVTQPIEPQRPEAYNANRADSAWLMQGISQIISRSQIFDLRRKYEAGMPARVQVKGLPAAAIPFGYRKPPGHESDRSAIPVPDPALAPFIIKLKDLLLAGRSLPQLVKFAEGTGIHPPRSNAWYHATIRGILRNPFYAGYNRWGLSKNHVDPRTGQRIRNRHVRQADIIMEKGLHDPLWDDATYQAIQAELDRRGTAYPGKQTSAFSRLLACSRCNKPLWLQRNGPRSEPNRLIWRCSSHLSDHAAITHTAALEQFASQLQEQIRHAPVTEEPIPVPQPDPDPSVTGRLAELKTRRQRLEDAYIAGGFNLSDYMKRAADLDAQITRAEDELHDLELQATNRVARIALITTLAGAVEHIPAWLTQSDPLEVNRTLHILLKRVVIHNDEIQRLEFRD